MKITQDYNISIHQTHIKNEIRCVITDNDSTVLGILTDTHHDDADDLCAWIKSTINSLEFDKFPKNNVGVYCKCGNIIYTSATEDDVFHDYYNKGFKIGRVSQEQVSRLGCNCMDGYKETLRTKKTIILE